MEEINFESLNEQQLNAMKAVDGAILVTAGAGSGKTRLLTHRICYLIQKFGVMPYNILAITFTNKAANEMKERIQSMMPNINGLWISTFHSMCVRILREHISDLDPRFDKNFSIYSDTETDKILKTLIVKHNVEDDGFLKTMKFHISNRKNQNMSYEKYKLEHDYERNIAKIVLIMQEYQANLIENNALDFDDLLIATYNLFKQRPDVLELYAKRFEYILVDEFQDTNVIQYELVKMLASYHKNVFAVGDEDQCIYTWRGANFKNLFKFKEDFENAQCFKLEKNYRSTKIILDCANKLIKNNKSRIDKTLWSDIDGGSPIEYRELYDEQAEADYIARTIIFLVQNAGYQYKDFAILMRLNALSFPFEQSLLNYNIPHKIFGGFKFYERAEIKNVLSYLKLFVNPKDEQALLRIINFPKRGIGDGSMEKIKEYSLIHNNTMLETILDIENTDFSSGLKNKFTAFANTYKLLANKMQSFEIDEFAKQVVELFQITSAFSNKTDEDTDKILNISQLLMSITKFKEQNLSADLSDYLQSVLLIADIDTMDDSNNTTVATIHSVKGLEFKVVFIIGNEEKIFPISRAYNNDEDMEEERRLMYVAITRAKERLYLTNCKTRFLYGHRDYMLASRFIGEIGCGKVYAPTAQVFNNKTTRSVNSQVDFVKQSLNQKFSYEKFLENKTQAKDISIFKSGSLVLHTKYGMGTISCVDYEEKTADVVFDGIGTKTLMLEIAPLKLIK